MIIDIESLTNMVDLWRDFPSGPNPPDEVNIVIELTRGSRNKYEYDAYRGVFKLNRVLYTYYPCDYGFIPRTLDDDGDPLDAVLLINEPTFPGCVAVARPVANIRMIDQGQLDDKIVCVSTTDPFYRHIQSLDDIPVSLVRELTYFYENYKRAEGKKTAVEGWDNADKAKKIIEWSREEYRKLDEK